MSTGREQPATPAALWQRNMEGTQRWVLSGFRDDSAARAAQRALQEWLGAYPGQAADITKLALSSAFTARQANAYEHAYAFANVAVEASAFSPLVGVDDLAAATLAAVILAESALERGSATDAGWALQYARDLVTKMDATSALHVWARSQCDLIAGLMAESILERQQATVHYTAASDTSEPLLRNARLRRELTNDWLRVLFGDAQQMTGQSEAAGAMVRKLVSEGFVLAAAGAARVALPESAAVLAVRAAEACGEFGVPRGMSAVELHAALARLPDDESRLALIDKVLATVENGSDRKSHSMTAVLRGLRALSKTNPVPGDDLARAGKAGIAAADEYAWAAITADMIEHSLTSEQDGASPNFDMFWVAYGQGESGVRGTPRHLPYRAAFERTLAFATDNALKRYATAPSADVRSWLSVCVEATRSTTEMVDLPRSGKVLDRLGQARLDAADWLGRMAHALKDRTDVIVLIPAATPDDTILLCITGDAGIEAHATGPEYESAMRALAEAMHDHFVSRRVKSDMATPGKRAFASLPGRAQELLKAKQVVLIVPDASGERLAIPWELLHGEAGFLGVTHVVARFPSLRAAALAVEPSLAAPAAHESRALCIAAPDTIPTEPLHYAEQEVVGVREALRGDWQLPLLSDEELGPEVLLHGLELGTLVHVAAHGEAFGGTHAILLPRGERLTTEEITAYRGELPAFVYLSVCSIGASEYLGGGVSRGMAAALSAKGAAALIASQWPLQDAAAAKFAKKFYESALGGTVGDAMHAARVHVAESVSPALWGSLILIGNPWHRFGTNGQEDDATTKLLRVAGDSSATPKARAAAIRAAKTALKRDPAHLRLAAAVAWAEEAKALFGSDGTPPSAQWADTMADLARDLGASAGEVLFRTTAFDLHSAGGADDAALHALDRAIDVGERLARSDSAWSRVVLSLLARRQTSDLTVEVPEVRLSSGLVVNDRSDPAVRAVFEVQHAVDQREVRTAGTLRLRLPERSIEDLAWNAIVLGKRSRFPTEFACAAFAERVAARAIAAGYFAAAAEPDVRRVLAGLLRFLWSTQRMTHLERERATGQAHTLLTALDALSTDEIRIDAEVVERRRSILELQTQLVATVDQDAGDRFARVRARLRGENPEPGAGALATAIATYIAEAPSGSMLRAHRAVWSYGVLLETAQDLRTKGNTGLAGAILAEYAELERKAEGNLMPYLFEGFTEARSAPLDPLIEWRFGAGQRNPVAATPG